MTTKLDPRPARPFTSREVSSLLNALIGGILNHTDEATVKDALAWSLDHFDEVSTMIRAAKEKLERVD